MDDFNQIKFQIGGLIEFIKPIPNRTGDVIVTVRYDGFTATSKGTHMSYSLPNGKLINVQVAFVDSKGAPAKVDGVVTWASSDTSIATTLVDPGDSTICRISSVAVGSTTISAEADADLGAGIRALTVTLDLMVVEVGGEAVAGTITVIGEPQDIAPHPELQSQARSKR